MNELTFFLFSEHGSIFPEKKNRIIKTHINENHFVILHLEITANTAKTDNKTNLVILLQFSSKTKNLIGFFVVFLLPRMS